MGIVYAGLAEEPDGRTRPVAVKVIHPHLADAPEFRTRFRSEATLAARVARFSTAAVLDVDVEGDQPFLVTEFVDGPTLQDVVDEQGPLAGGALDAVAIGIATALVAIHEAGIVHRDLKPSNVILSRFGPRVIDFGIARAADLVSGLTSGAIGSPPYMAPEQFRGGPVTPATDVHAWGAAVCFAGTGKPPFGIGAPEVMLYRTLELEPELTALDESLRELVGAALRKDPATRPGTQELLTALTLQRPGVLPSLPPVLPDAVLPDAEPAPATSAGAASAGPAGAEPVRTPAGPGPAGAEPARTTAGLGSAAQPTVTPTPDAARPGAAPASPGGGDADGTGESATAPGDRARRGLVLRTAVAAVALAVAAGAAVVWSSWPDAGRERSADLVPTPAPNRTVRQVSADDTARGPVRAVAGVRRGGTVEVYAAADFWELDPVRNRFSDGMMASSRLLARTLTAYREDGVRPATLVGDLATDTGRSTDGGSTWEFTIRDQIRFADGSAVTAHDVAHGIARSFGEQATGPSYLAQWLADRPDFRSVYRGPTKEAPYPPGVEVPDDRTLRLRFTRPHPDLPAAAALPSTAAVPAGWQPTRADPIPATGPYRVADADADRRLTLERNPNWNAESDPVRTDYPDRYVVHFGSERSDVTRLMMSDDEPRGVQLTTIDASQASEIYRLGLDNRLVDGVGSGHATCVSTRSG